jgi:hypothetical protein
VGDRDIQVIEGDCLSVLPTLEAGSVDCVVTDPPYPEIDREYGRWTEAGWHGMMRSVVAECRRVLTPKGSAVFILQPNSERVGRMRPWLWEFMAWTAREWNQVQDAWWWNLACLPNAGVSVGLMRASLKACVWLGPEDCYRDQGEVLDRSEKEWMKRRWDQAQPDERRMSPSGNSVNGARMLAAVKERGGSTPFNVLPMGNGSRHDMAGMHGHGAGTPINVADWWIRYICPPGGLVLDPFAGSATIGLAAARLRRRYLGIERHAPYVQIARDRLEGPPMPLFDEPRLADAATPLFRDEDAAHA